MNIFDGIYKSFDDAESTGPGFSSDKWVESCANKLRNVLNGNDDFLIRQNLLPFLTSLNSNKKKIIVLDFGGGIGITYAEVSRSIANKRLLEYHIVDNERICKEGRKIFKSDGKVIFHSQLPKIDGVDIVHLGSSLQYINNWKSELAKLVSYRPAFILFDDLHAGNIPTFVTLQNYYGSKIPCWFFNLDEVIGLMKKLRFGLIFKSKQRISYFGKEQKIPLSNLPTKYRIDDTMCLLFRSSDPARV